MLVCAGTVPDRATIDEGAHLEACCKRSRQDAITARRTPVAAADGSPERHALDAGNHSRCGETLCCDIRPVRHTDRFRATPSIRRAATLSLSVDTGLARIRGPVGT